MQEQQPLIMGYIDLFVSRLKDLVARNENKPTKVDIVSWFNFATFDIIGDLAFGKPFDCLEHSKSHPWVEALFQGVHNFSSIVTIKWYFSSAMPYICYLLGIGKPQRQTAAFAEQRVKERLNLEKMEETKRPDFVASMTSAKKDGLEFSHLEIQENMRFLVLAGSETTATALSGAAFYLCRHKEVQKRLAEEVRGSFKTEEEIDMHSVARLKYMLAVLDETLRCYPPVSGTMPRTCQEEGDVICGMPVPGGVSFFALSFFFLDESG